MTGGRDIMKGRHAIGGRTANAGKMRRGQSEPASNKIKTVAKPEWQKGRPFTPNAKDTSADAQRFISEAPDPFKDSLSTPNMPAGKGPRGAVPGQEPKNIYAGKKGSSVGQSNPSGSAVGYNKLPNQAKQIGGRMGFPPPSRKAGVNGAGFKAKKGAAFYGE